MRARSAPIRQVSEKQHRRQQALSAIKRDRTRRAWLCEGCGATNTALELHHIVGRRGVVSRDLADSPECLALLCPRCHRSVTSPAGAGDLEFRDVLRWQAADRLAERHGDPPPPRGDNPLDVIRYYDRAAEGER